MTWTGNPRTTTAAWRRIRRLVLERDGHRCTMALCPFVDDLVEVDHIVPHSKGGTDDPANLTTLCLTHHRRKSAREGQAASNAARLRLARPPESHPGIVVRPRG